MLFLELPWVFTQYVKMLLWPLYCNAFFSIAFGPGASYSHGRPALWTYAVVSFQLSLGIFFLVVSEGIL